MESEGFSDSSASPTNIRVNWSIAPVFSRYERNSSFVNVCILWNRWCYFRRINDLLYAYLNDRALKGSGSTTNFVAEEFSDQDDQLISEMRI